MNTPSRPVRAAIYLRISEDREMDGLAIDRQREDCQALAASRGWEVVEVYVDQSVSATSKTKRRPEYDRMVKDYDAGHFSAIVCYDLDRLTRQPRQLEDWIDRAEERGLALVTANGDADLSTDGGRLYARLKAAVARGEMERKGARQSRAHRQRAEQGRPPKGVRPVGYATDGSLIDIEAKAVRAIYQAFNAGTSLRSIARALSGQPDSATASIPRLPRHKRTLTIERNQRREDEGLPLKKVPDDGPWPPSTVLSILRNPRYAGYSVYTPTKERQDKINANREIRESGEQPRGKRRTWRESIVLDNDGRPVLGRWEPIVSEGLWRSVQDRLDDPKRVTNRRGTHRKHLGSGLYLCGVCGEPVRSVSRGYQCRSKGHPNRTGKPIDEHVENVVALRLSMPDALATEPADESPRLREIATEIERQRALIARAQRDYDGELIEATDLKRIRGRSNDTIEALSAERLTLSHGASVVPILRTEDPAAAFLNADLGVRRSVIEVLCTVTLLPARQGVRGFDPDSVRIGWR